MAISTNYYNYQNASALFSKINGGYGFTDPAEKLRSLTSALNGKVGTGASSGTGSVSTGGIDYYMQKYVVGIKSNASELKSALNDLMGGSYKASTYSKKSVASSDEEKVSATVASGIAGRNAKDTTITIEQVASGQINEGNTLNGSDQINSSGYQQFAIDIGGKSHQFSFEVSSGDTNKMLQQKMADAINQRGIGVSATVVSGNNGESTLSIQAKETGDDDNNRFSIRDVVGGSVGSTGVANVKQEAQDARYRVDGGSIRTSGGNTVDLGNGITATLKEAGGEEIVLKVTTDPGYTMDKVRSMVESFNGLLSTVDDNVGARGTVGGDKLRNELASISKAYASSLDRLGISVDGKGYMSISQAKLEDAVQSGSVERFFTGGGSGSYGFANRLSKSAADINRSPTNYMGGVYPNSVYMSNMLGNTDAATSAMRDLDFTNYAAISTANNIGLMFTLLI